MTSVNTYIDIDRLIKKMGKTDWYKALGGQAHHHIKTLLKFTSGTSLVVQRLRIHAPNIGGPGSILGQGTRSHMLQLKIPAVKYYCYTQMLFTQSCPTLCVPADVSPPGSSVHGILQTRILEWEAIPFSRESSRPKD